MTNENVTETAAAAIPESAWEWFGHAGHFIGGHDCLWHLCTRVGNYLISSVGDYRPATREADRVDRPACPIGCNRLYETYVFRLGNEPHQRCECGCGLASPVDLSEIDSMPAGTARDATTNHFVMCRRYAATEVAA